MKNIFSICDNFAKKNQVIEDIYLYGSYARQENDENSDMDILIIVNENNYNLIKSIKEKIAKDLNFPLDWISVYSVGKIEEMKMYGAYFLWHLKLEGIKIYSKDEYLYKTIIDLPNYSNCKDDVLQYKEICNDIEHSIQSKSYNIVYELNLLASVIRNSSIAYSFSTGKYIFGRYTPVIYVKDRLADTIQFDINEYKQIYRYRIMYNRGKYYRVDEDSINIIYKWLRIVEVIIESTLINLEGR